MKFSGPDKNIKPVTPIIKPIHFLIEIISFKNILARIRINRGMEAKYIATSLVSKNFSEQGIIENGIERKNTP